MSAKRDAHYFIQNDSVAEALEKYLMHLCQSIDRIISKSIDEETSDSKIIFLFNKELPRLDGYTNLATDTLLKYLERPSRKKSLQTRIEETLDNADEWSINVDEVYFKLELYEVENTQRLLIEVTPFTPSGNQTIYEFLSDFKNCYKGRGCNQIKALKMWQDHLSSDVKLDTEVIKRDLSKLTNYLIATYGDIDTVTDCLLKDIEERDMPLNSDNRQKWLYMMKLSATLKKIYEIPNFTSIERQCWENLVFSGMFMCRLRVLLAQEDHLEFLGTLDNEEWYERQVHGENAFKKLLSFTEKEAEVLRAVYRQQREREQRLLTLQAQETNSRSLECDTSSAGSENITNGESGSIENLATNSTKVSKPCGLRGHHHELGVCADFLSQPASKRRTLTEKRLCWTCLGPRAQCRKKSRSGSHCCKNLQNLDNRLLCGKCTEYASKRNK